MSDAPAALARSDNSESRSRRFYDGGSCWARVSVMQTAIWCDRINGALWGQRQLPFAPKSTSGMKPSSQPGTVRHRLGKLSAGQDMQNRPGTTRTRQPCAGLGRQRCIGGAVASPLRLSQRIVLTSRFTRDWLRRSTAGDGQAGPPVRPSRSRSPAAFVAESRGRTR
jgi:hypothetical protein